MAQIKLGQFLHKTTTAAVTAENPLHVQQSGNKVSFINETQEIRDTSEITIDFPQMEDGIFEQAMFFQNDLDQPVDIEIQTLFGEPGDPFVTHGSFRIISVSLDTDNRKLVLLPDTTNDLESNGNYHLKYPELSQPVYGFRVRLKCSDAPTTGVLYVFSHRRY